MKLRKDNMKENDMTTIYLIRHAEAEGNRYRRAHGWYNSTITDRGNSGCPRPRRGG